MWTIELITDECILDFYNTYVMFDFFFLGNMEEIKAEYNHFPKAHSVVLIH